MNCAGQRAAVCSAHSRDTTPNLHNPLKIARIRKPFSHRILGFISPPVQSLKDSLVGALGLRVDDDSQPTLAEFGERETCADSALSDQLADDDSGSDGEESSSEDTETKPEQGIVYVRVSSSEQESEGCSLEAQEEELLSIIDNREDMESYCEPIRDAGESGTNFDRDGIQRVYELAKAEDVTHLLVDDIDRIGRTVPETLMFIQQLRDEYDVKVMVRTEELDMKKVSDRMRVTMMALMADIGTMHRARSSLRSSARGFLKDNNWNSWYQVVPVGYRADGDGWITRDTQMVPVIRDVYETFREVEEYAGTRRRVNEKHGDRINQVLRKRLPDESEGENEEENDGRDENGDGESGDENEIPDGLTDHQIKMILKRPLYVGRPSIPVQDVENYGPNPSVEDSDLQIVSEELFDEVQQIVAEIEEKYSSDDEIKSDPEGLTEEFNPWVLEMTSPIVDLHCPACGGELVSNGERTLSGDIGAHRYKCSDSDCDYHRKWPREDDEELMKMLTKIDQFRELL